MNDCQVGAVAARVGASAGAQSVSRGWRADGAARAARPRGAADRLSQRLVHPRPAGALWVGCGTGVGWETAWDVTVH